MIDDFSVSGVKDSTSAHNKIDLHTIDAFAGVVRSCFESCERRSLDSQLVAKTMILKVPTDKFLSAVIIFGLPISPSSMRRPGEWKYTNYGHCHLGPHVAYLAS